MSESLSLIFLFTVVEIFLPIFWFLRQIKVILFWLYLWQLKEYRLDRFLDHFRTEKGKRLLFNRLILIKIIFILILSSYILYSHFAYPGEKSPLIQPNAFIEIPLIISSIIIFFGSFILYLLEGIKRQLRMPVITSKILILTIISLGLMIYLVVINYKLSDLVYFPFSRDFFASTFFFLIGLLFFDLLTPLFIFLIVFCFQPLTFFWKNRLIKKAKKKRAQFKDLLVIGIILMCKVLPYTINL